MLSHPINQQCNQSAKQTTAKQIFHNTPTCHHLPHRPEASVLKNHGASRRGVSAPQGDVFRGLDPDRDGKIDQSELRYFFRLCGQTDVVAAPRTKTGGHKLGRKSDREMASSWGHTVGFEVQNPNSTTVPRSSGGFETSLDP